MTCYTATKLANGNENVDESGMNIPENYILEGPIDESSVDGQACSPDDGNSQMHDIKWHIMKSYLVLRHIKEQITIAYLKRFQAERKKLIQKNGQET